MNTIRVKIKNGPQAGMTGTIPENEFDPNIYERLGLAATIQKGGDIMRSIGLGAIPTIAGGVYEAGRAGYQALGGKNAYLSEEGQFKENPFLSQQRLTNIADKPVMEATKNTAGLASWAVPAGKSFSAIKGAGSVGLPAVGKWLGGKMVTGGTQAALQNLSSQEDGVDVGKIGKSAVAGSVVNPLVSAPMEALGGLVNFLGKKVPKDIKAQTVIAPLKKKMEMLDNLNENLFKKNKEYAINEGIATLDKPLSGSMLDDAISKTQELLQKRDDELTELLSNSKVKVPYDETIGKLKKMVADELPSETMVGNKTKFVNELGDWFDKQAGVTRAGGEISIGGQSLGNISPGLKKAIEEASGGVSVENPEISLNTLNQIKRKIGEGWNKSKVNKKMYNFLQTYIEEKGGAPSVIKLNDHLKKLMDIRGNLLKIQEQGIGKGMNKYTEKGLENAVMSNIGIPASLKATVSGLSSLLGLATGTVLKGTGLRGVASTTSPFLYYKYISDYLRNNPVAQQGLAEMLEKLYASGESLGSSVAGKVTQKAYQQLPRLGGMR